MFFKLLPWFITGIAVGFSVRYADRVKMRKDREAIARKGMAFLAKYIEKPIEVKPQ